MLIFFAMSCATTIYTNLDTVMLGFMTTDAEVGYYNAAVKIKVILVSVVTSLGTVLLPRASYYIQTGELKEFRRITRKALNFVMLIATPLMLYFIYFAKEGIYFFIWKCLLRINSTNAGNHAYFAFDWNNEYIRNTDIGSNGTRKSCFVFRDCRCNS